jgi:hypothetical protein
MDASDYRRIRQLFDDYLRMYSSRDDRLTTYFSEDFSGFTGGGDFLVKDREMDRDYPPELLIPLPSRPASSPSTCQYGGSCLGLAIVRSLVVMMQGMSASTAGTGRGGELLCR